MLPAVAWGYGGRGMLDAATLRSGGCLLLHFDYAQCEGVARRRLGLWRTGDAGGWMLDAGFQDCQLKDCHAAAWWLLPAAGNAGLRFNL